LIFLNAGNPGEDDHVLSAMPLSSHLSKTLIAAAVLSLNVFFCSYVEAIADVDYSKVGGWRIAYREVEDLTGCQAMAEFQDQTRVAIALIQDGNAKVWSVFISNPGWESWIAKKSEHFLWVVAMNPNKVWQGPWSVTENAKHLYISPRVEFINSLAAAKTLAIYDENKRLIASPLSMKHSEDAIKAVVNCVQDHPSKSASPPEARTRPDTSTARTAGTAFFVHAQSFGDQQSRSE
jgi:hypothetical protein